MGIPAKDFRNTVRNKGWTMSLLAHRWKISPEWLSRQVSDTDRDPRLDDALRGLPVLSRLERARLLKEAKETPSLHRRARKRQRDQDQVYEWRIVGAEVSPLEYLGEVADVGDYGAIVSILKSCGEKQYLVRFPGGDIVFDEEQLDSKVAFTGRVLDE